MGNKNKKFEIIGEYIKLAEDGKNADWALEILRIFCSQVDSNKGIDKSIRYYLRDSFNKILFGEDAASALNIKNPPHRPIMNPERDMDIALDVARKKLSGKKLDEIYNALAEQFNLSPDTIKKIYLKYRSWAIEQAQTEINNK